MNTSKSQIFYFFVIISFFYGVYIGHYKHFPFYILYKIKNIPNLINKVKITHKYQDPLNLKSPLRNFNLADDSLPIEIDLSNDIGVYLTYGQSNSANHGEIGYEVKNKVYESVLGQEYKYVDPSYGGTGLGGSVWGMVGDKAIDFGLHDKVIFANCGWSALTIEELKELQYIRCLIMNYHSLMTKFGKVDGILFHQGESNNSSEGLKNYYNEFVDLLNILKTFDVDIPIYLSRASYCKDKQKNKKLIEIQNNLILDFELIKEGPNTDKIMGKNFRFDRCHFTLEGYDVFSDMWIDALKR